MSLPDHTALLIIDIQKPYLNPSRDVFNPCDIGGKALMRDIQQTVASLGPETLVIYIVAEPDWCSSTWKGWTPKHLLPGKHDVKPRAIYDVPDDFIPPEAHIFSKPGSSAFPIDEEASAVHEGNLLHAFLQKHGILNVIALGLHTGTCVLETARDAAKAGYKTDIAVNLCRDPSTFDNIDEREEWLLAKMAKQNIADVGIITLDASANIQPQRSYPTNPSQLQTPAR
ncbi:MAG: isochorismatase family protein [Alphaproteobacteria bacterium]